ncbi:lysostaphin resistance A-like protein [Clostridium sp. DL1XJH146]
MLREKQEYYPKIKNAILILFAYLFLSNFCYLIYIYGHHTINSSLLVSAVIKLFCLLLIIAWLKLQYKISFKVYLSTKPLSFRKIISILLTILSLSIIVSELTNLLTIFIPIKGFWLEVFNNTFNSQNKPVQLFLCIVILAPIMEELLFRGLILKGFLKHYSYKKAIFLSSLLFGIMHFNPWQFLAATLAGIFIGWCYYKTNSLLICIISHSFFNFLGFITEDLFKLFNPNYISDYSNISFLPIWIDILSIVIFIFGVYNLDKLFKNKY